MGETKKRRKYTAQESRKTLPAVKEFNGLAKLLLKLLSQKVEAKEKRLGSIKVMLDQFASDPKNLSTISIKTVDINETIVKRSGRFSYNQKMSWEGDLKGKKRGFIL